MAYFVGKIFSTTLLFQISKVKFLMDKIVKRIFFKKTFFYRTIFEDSLLIFEIGNCRVVKNNVFEKISHD